MPEINRKDLLHKALNMLFEYENFCTKLFDDEEILFLRSKGLKGFRLFFFMFIFFPLVWVVNSAKEALSGIPFPLNLVNKARVKKVKIVQPIEKKISKLEVKAKQSTNFLKKGNKVLGEMDMSPGKEQLTSKEKLQKDLLNKRNLLVSQELQLGKLKNKLEKTMQTAVKRTEKRFLARISRYTNKEACEKHKLEVTTLLITLLRCVNKTGHNLIRDYFILTKEGFVPRSELSYCRGYTSCPIGIELLCKTELFKKMDPEGIYRLKTNLGWILPSEPFPRAKWLFHIHDKTGNRHVYGKGVEQRPEILKTQMSYTLIPYESSVSSLKSLMFQLKFNTVNDAYKTIESINKRYAGRPMARVDVRLLLDAKLIIEELDSLPSSVQKKVPLNMPVKNWV